LNSNLSLESIPDLHALTVLQYLDISYTSISLPVSSSVSSTGSDYLLPPSIVELYASSSPMTIDEFEYNIASYMSLLEILMLDDTFVTDITSLSSIQTSNITHLSLAGNGSLDGAMTILPLMSALVELDVSDCDLSELPDLSASASSLVSFFAASNSSIKHLGTILSPLTSLVTIGLSNCSLTDISPLYSLPMLMSVDVSQNRMCLVNSNNVAEVRSKFVNGSVGAFELFISEQSCYCEEYSFENNMVCSESAPGSDRWYVVCASDSYITYSDASTFTCTQPTDPDINCAGGCEYGQECKNVDDDASQGYCADIITDSVLRECLYEYLDPVDTVQDLHVFSVVSLKYLPLEIDCSSRAIVTLDGFEHAANASTFTCTQPTDPDINCAGGCEYGQECKNVDDDASQGYCADIITDSVLRECLYEYLDPVDTVQDLHVFSVVSLKYLPLEIDCSSRAIVTLDGFEHAANVSTFNLSGCTSLTDIIALSPLIYLQELYLSGCSSISEWPFSSLNLSYAFETLDISDCNIDDEIIASTVPFLPELTSLFLRDNSSFSDMSCLYDLKDHLVSLDVANTGISSISALYANPQCSDTCSSLVESMSIASVISVVEDCVLCSEEALNENGVLSELDITSAPLDDYEELRHFPMLSKLSADSCNVTNFDLLHITPLDQLSYLSLNSNSISDPSPLYILSPSLMTLYLDENMICGTDASEGIKGKLEMGTCEVSCANQLCRCGTVFNSSNAVEDNKVCMETKTGSNSWYIVCAADSFFQYSSGAEFDCIETPSTNASSTTENVQTCVGGCEYGQECRVQDISTNSGVCLPVIVDDSLRQWIVDNFFDSDSIHIDSSVNPPLLSVASLKSVIDEEVIEFDYVEGESEGDSVTTLEGVEHLGFIIRSISLVGHGISSVSPLGSMTLLNKLDLSDNAVSDISWISQLCLL
ncbi:hypothetical protein ADUPG1_000703, partial [Aduncisulcus paluster]